MRSRIPVRPWSQDLEMKQIFVVCFVFRILAPTTYIFFASAIPVISFGEQLERNTGKWSSKK
jgi:hypothetical protein